MCCCGGGGSDGGTRMGDETRTCPPDPSSTWRARDWKKGDVNHSAEPFRPKYTYGVRGTVRTICTKYIVTVNYEKYPAGSPPLSDRGVISSSRKEEDSILFRILSFRASS